MMPEEAFEAFRRFKDSPHIALRGIHLHIGSQNPEPHAYADAFQMLWETLVQIHKETGTKLEHINLGGGFPVNYLRDRSQAGEFPREQREMFSADFEPSDAIDEAWKLVKNIAADTETTDVLDGITLLLEPGRSIIADAGVCLTTVRNHKTRPIDAIRNPKSKIQNRHLASDRRRLQHPALDGNLQVVLPSDLRRRAPVRNMRLAYKLAGPALRRRRCLFRHRRPISTCRIIDFLPEDVEPGEVLALLNCGAYSLAQASQYNGRFLPRSC